VIGRAALPFTLALASALLGCERPRAETVPEDAAPSPNASILPAPLTSVATPVDLGAHGLDAGPAVDDRARILDAGIPPAEPVRVDRPLSSDYVGSKETTGISLTFEVKFPDAPPPPRAPEVSNEGISAARKATALRWTVAASEAGRLRIAFEGRGFPVPGGTELRARIDRYGHALVFPGGNEYRVVAPGGLRPLFGERRLDAVPLVLGEVAQKGAGPVRAGHTTRRLEVTSKMGVLTLDLAKIADAGLGATLLCRTFVDFLGVDPSLPVCPVGEIPLRAQLVSPGGGGVVFEAIEVSRKTELPASDLHCPPPSSQLARVLLPGAGPGVVLTREEAAALRQRAIDVGPPAPGAPPEGLLARNATDGLRYLLIDGINVGWVLPSSEATVTGLLRGRYVVQWRSFLGEAVDPPRTLEVPGRIAVGEPADAGAPPPPKTKLSGSRLQAPGSRPEPDQSALGACRRKVSQGSGEPTGS
jgi:hypothetical protein